MWPNKFMSCSYFTSHPLETVSVYLQPPEPWKASVPGFSPTRQVICLSQLYSPALEVGGRWVQVAPAASQCSKPHSPWSLQMPQHITRVYLFIYLRSWELWQKPRVPAEAGSSGSTVSLSSQHVAVRAKGWLESAHGACIANWVLNFSENLGLNVDSLILLGFGICFKILCGSQKLRDYCQCTKQMDSTRFHPFGSRQIMPLE